LGKERNLKLNKMTKLQKQVIELYESRCFVTNELIENIKDINIMPLLSNDSFPLYADRLDNYILISDKVRFLLEFGNKEQIFRDLEQYKERIYEYYAIRDDIMLDYRNES